MLGMVRRYEMNVVLTFNDHGLKIDKKQTMYFMADNVDHNPANLDGRNTVHWMGMVLAVSPANSDNLRLVPRSEVSNEQLVNLTSNIVQTFNAEGLKSLGGMI